MKTRIVPEPATVELNDHATSSLRPDVEERRLDPT